MLPIVLFGLGKIAEVVRALLTEAGRSVVAHTVDAAYLTRPVEHGLPVVPFETVQERFSPATHEMLVAIGYHDLNRLRAARCAAARDKGYALASFVSVAAQISASCAIGEHCVVMPGAALQPHATLGADVFLWHNAVIGHHARIGDHGWLASNCTVSSGTVLGSRCFVGVNAAIGHAITLGEACLIGAGAVVTADAPAGGVYVKPPTPRFRLDSERFLRITRLR